MTVAVDTNVLVRYLTLDHADQAVAATKLLESDTELFISIPVLCELAWVLARSFRYPSADIAQAIRAVTAPYRVKADRLAIAAGLDMLERGGDFADGCVLSEALRVGCRSLMTFDRSFARAGAPMVQLLS